MRIQLWRGKLPAAGRRAMSLDAGVVPRQLETKRKRGLSPPFGLGAELNVNALEVVYYYTGVDHAVTAGPCATILGETLSG